MENSNLRKRLEEAEGMLEGLRREFDFRVRKEVLESLEGIKSRLEEVGTVNALKKELEKAVKEELDLIGFYTFPSWYDKTTRRIAGIMREMIRRERQSKMEPVEHV